MFGEAPLQNGLIRRLLDDAWSLQVDRVEYLAVGYGSYHWRASGRDAWFVTADRAEQENLSAVAYGVSRQLSDDGLGFVRAPVRHRNDGVVWEVDGWWVTVWPWLEGRTAPGLEHGSAADRQATLRCIRRLHDHVSTSPVEGLVEDWSIPLRSDLVELLRNGPAGNGPYAKEVGALVADTTDVLIGLMNQYDALTTVASASDVGLVVTHGEPHAGNVVHTDAGTMLIDWDTVRWAPRERDLWSFAHHEDWRQGYGDDIHVCDDTIEAYRLQWSLVDIADFATSLALADVKNPDLEVALTELRRYLTAHSAE